MLRDLKESSSFQRFIVLQIVFRWQPYRTASVLYDIPFTTSCTIACLWDSLNGLVLFRFGYKDSANFLRGVGMLMLKGVS
jgi:hypothetical protein